MAGEEGDFNLTLTEALAGEVEGINSTLDDWTDPANTTFWRDYSDLSLVEMFIVLPAMLFCLYHKHILIQRGLANTTFWRDYFFSVL